jgi:hypothetical protein
MECLSREQSILRRTELLPEIDFSIEGVPRSKGGGFDSLRHALPRDSGKKVALTKCLYNFVRMERRVLVLLNNWQVFPSSGHVPLVLRVRQALGESRPLVEFPGHLFSSDEHEDGISVVLVSAQFFWDCFVVGESATTFFFLSHDEYYEFYTRDSGVFAEFKRMVAHFLK